MIVLDAAVHVFRDLRQDLADVFDLSVASAGRRYLLADTQSPDGPVMVLLLLRQIICIGPVSDKIVELMYSIPALSLESPSRFVPIR